MLSRFLKKKPELQPYCIRFGYHKCLTRYMGAIFDKNKHFLGNRIGFATHLRENHPGRFISINNNIFWVERKIFDHARMIHLMRHPKDVVISGYFYHKKGPEKWTVTPLLRRQLYKFSFELNQIYNEAERKLLHPEITYQQLLEALPYEKGMMTEMIWLKHIKTFNPIVYYQAPQVKTFRFEEIMSDPPAYVRQMCTYWQLSEEEIEYYSQRAAHFNRNPSYPVRDSSAYQFKKHFNKALDQFFSKHFNDVVGRLDYPD